MFGVEDTNNQPVANSAVPPPAPAANPISGAHDPVAQAPTPAATPSSHDDLLALKQQVLGSLTPMVDKLDQSPEEKFKTLMMVIQASDNVSLIKDAYAAAQAIPDEKARAQALIDVVNEINYFTAKNNN
jgi:hypothetical protein